VLWNEFFNNPRLAAARLPSRSLMLVRVVAADLL